MNSKFVIVEARRNFQNRNCFLWLLYYTGKWQNYGLQVQSTEKYFEVATSESLVYDSCENFISFFLNKCQWYC